MVAIALPAVTIPRPIGVSRINVGAIAQPVEIVEDTGFELATRSSPIVILYPQKNSSTQRRRLSPHEFSVEDMTEMQPTSRRRCETSNQDGAGSGSLEGATATVFSRYGRVIFLIIISGPSPDARQYRMPPEIVAAVGSIVETASSRTCCRVARRPLESSLKRTAR